MPKRDLMDLVALAMTRTNEEIMAAAVVCRVDRVDESGRSSPAARRVAVR